MAGTQGPRLFHGDEAGPLARRLLTIRLLRLTNFIQRSGSLAYRRVSGLSDFEWLILALVCETPPLSISELGGMLRRDAGQVSRAVKRLVSVGLLQRKNKGGGPGVLVTPTPLGRTVYGPLEGLAAERDAAIIRGLSSEEISTLSSCIEKLTDNALELLAREQALQESEQEPQAAE